MNKIAIVALAAATFLAGLAPANAFPTSPPNAPAATSSDVHAVQYRDDDRRIWRNDRRDNRQHWRDDRRDDRRNWRDDRRDDRFGWHRGHRGYRDYRPGYRRHTDGYWYPLAALGLGTVIVTRPSRPVTNAGVNPRHVAWCTNQYRSYRSYDNTFQPVGGPRQQCLSPYF